MALIVEDGTGVANADSYSSVADADAYFTRYGIPAAWGTAALDVKEGALRNATRFVDQSVRFFGKKVVESQALEFPRTEFVTTTGEIVPEGVIPDLLKDATIEAAGTHLSANLNTATTKTIKSESYGSTSITYAGISQVYVGQLKSVFRWLYRFGVSPTRQIPILRS